MKKSLKRLAVGFTTALSALTLGVVVFADDTATGGESAISAVTSAMTTSLADFSATNIVSIIVAALAIAIPLIIAWFAFRFIYGKAKGAFRRGK